MGELTPVGSQGSVANNNNEPRFKPGALRSLKLTNFMCHESFELTFGSSVNFIIGPNGSGKSALLTAIVYVLGARASATSRAKKQNEFIMYGKKSAKVQLTLHNYETIMEIDNAYKPDEYGKKIIIEKRIFDDGMSKLELKSEKGKRVSERKQELDNILEFFSILVNNPICILNQEISKTFLHSNKPEDQYDLFVKATSIEQITDDYSLAEEYHSQWNQYNDRNRVAFKILDNEFKLCQEKTKFILNRHKLNSRRDYLSKELRYSSFKVVEAMVEESNETKQSIQKAIDQAKKEIAEKAAKINTVEQEIDAINVEVQSFTDRAGEAKKKVDDHKSKDTQIRMKLIDSKTRIDRATKEIERKKRNIASLEKSINEIKQQFKDQNNLDQDNERRKIDIESYEKELAHEKAREITLRAHTEQLGISMTETRTDLHRQSLRVSEVKNKISQAEATLRRLKAGVENRLRKYGDHMVKIVDKIEEAHKQGRFIKKPIGPMGYYVRLSNPEVAKALEVHLARTAHAFVCDNAKDRAVLTSIFDYCMRGLRMRQPIVITRPFVARFDPDRLKANHNIYKTLLDYVEVERPEVFNALLDRANLHGILFIPDYKEAENLMINQRLIPPNTISAYTSDASCMTPRTATGGYKCMSNLHARGDLFVENNTNQIKSIERDIENLKIELRDLERIYNELDISNKAQRAEYDKNREESRKILEACRAIEQKLLDLKTVVVAEPQEISALEEELETLTRQIEETKIVIEAETDQKKEMENELKEIQMDKASSIKTFEKIQADIKERKATIEKSQKLVQLCSDVIQQKEKLIEAKSKDLKAVEDELRSLREKLEILKGTIDPEFEPPREFRSTDDIREEIQKLEAQLAAELQENRDTDEVLAELRKRMKEIQDLKFLDEHNRNNFNKTKSALNDRKEKFENLKSATVGSVTSTFSAIINNMNMHGQMKIYMSDKIERGEVVQKGRTLIMNIDTHHTPTQRVAPIMSDNNSNMDPVSHSQPAPSRPKRARVSATTQEKENDSIGFRDTRSLSGGERSFATVAFVLSLWNHCHSPFKLMDEIDVFMDMVTRRHSYNALIRFAQTKEDGGQYLFFSPLELPKFEDIGLEVRVFLMPPIIRKRPHSQIQPVGSGDAPPNEIVAVTNGANAAALNTSNHTPSRLRRIL